MIAMKATLAEYISQQSVASRIEHGPPNEERLKVVVVVEVATVIMMMIAAISHQCEYQPRDEHK